MFSSLKKSIDKFRLKGNSSWISWLKNQEIEKEEKSQSIPLKSPPNGKTDVVLFYTSSRIVYKTFAECSSVISILRGLDIPFQERDVFITRKYLEELNDIFGKEVSLPQLFVKGKYVGGFSRVVELHECGKLKKMVEDYISQRPRRACRVCGDYRYIVCFVCSGSRKIYLEEVKNTVECWICNENGLVACPDCSLGGLELRKSCRHSLN